MKKIVIALFATIVAADAFTSGVRNSARVPSISASTEATTGIPLKEKIADELSLPCDEECGMDNYPNMPPSVHPGVVTGQALVDLLNDAKTRGEYILLR
jgi:fructose-bisphosphate aldolase class II